VSSGGLGSEVTPIVKLIQAPGWEGVMRVLTLPGIRHLETRTLRALSSYGGGPLRKYTRDLDEAAAIVESWRDRHTRFAVRHLVRAVIDWRGQIVTMSDRAYLTETMPMAVVWGREDQVIPVRHSSNVAALVPEASVTVLPDSGHFPHRDHPEQFVRLLDDFVRATEPAVYSRAKFRRLLRHGTAAPASPLHSVVTA
jgi:pimeloyl-ACP methyl ester carboxylesterase